MVEDFNIKGEVKKRVNKIALIDADFIKYLVSYDLIKNEFHNKENRIKDITMLTEERVNQVLEQFSCKGYIFCFSGKSCDTFRDKIALEKRYKGNRKGDLSYEYELEDKAFVMEHIMSHYPSLLFKDLEADDIVSMLQCKETFIYSKDKDLMQVPGTHFDIKTQEFIEVSKSQGINFLFEQMITGDTTDNIIGLKGYGSGKIKRLFKDDMTSSQRFSVVIKEYIMQNGLVNGIDLFTEMWMLLTMRTSRGHYFKDKYKQAFDLLNILKNTEL